MSYVDKADMGPREPRPVRGFADEDVMTGWRRVLCYTQRPGVASKIKRAYRRGERHQARAALR